MQQVGDLVELAIAPVPSTGSVIYSYVWDFWDSSSTATTAPFVTKVVNIGGQPGTDELWYTVRPVAIDGQYTTINGSILANNPPTILPGVSLTVNDGFFAYQTQMSVVAIEQDGDSMTFAWYSDGTFLSDGTLVAAGNADGTWTGNNTQVIASYPATQNYFDYVVTGDAIVTCYVWDDRGGTAHVNFLLRGEAAPAPAATTSAAFGNVSFDSSTPSTARIGTGQFIDFAVFVPPISGHTLGFLWSFSGSNGWTMPPVYEAGTTMVMPNGGYQNTVRRDISTEVVSSGTQKTVSADVRVSAVNNYTGDTTHTDAEFTITLIANSAPSSVNVIRTVNDTIITGGGPVAVGDPIEFAAVGTDPNNDILFCQWQFIQPFEPNTLYLWGPKVIHDTGSYTAGQSVEGVLTVYDWLGASLVFTLPSTTIEA